jgi:hypothetical protein
MFRRFVLVAVCFALFAPLTGSGCKDSKSGSPVIKDKAPANPPEPKTPGGPGKAGGKAGPKGASE